MESKPWHAIEERIHAMQFAEQFDLIVAIANGGIVPAALLQQKLKIPVELLKISFRDPTHKPLYNVPQLLTPIHFDVARKKILLVEDRVKTGATLGYARQLLKDAELVKTFAVNGKADYPLYDENCFSFPWVMKAGS
ncbi:MAG: phosphoribosyltransferase [Ferruginibacter sp.]|nr:phosphoribosyltransferase [Ferruginibacter sp.]